MPHQPKSQTPALALTSNAPSLMVRGQGRAATCLGTHDDEAVYKCIEKLTSPDVPMKIASDVSLLVNAKSCAGQQKSIVRALPTKYTYPRAAFWVSIEVAEVRMPPGRVPAYLDVPDGICVGAV